jgi:hypothetical protein
MQIAVDSLVDLLVAGHTAVHGSSLGSIPRPFYDDQTQRVVFDPLIALGRPLYCTSGYAYVVSQYTRDLNSIESNYL